MALLDFLSSKAERLKDFRLAWDGLIRAIDARFKPLEEQLDIQRATTDAIVGRGLQVIEDELAPVVAQGADVLTGIQQVKSDADEAYDAIVVQRDQGIDADKIISGALPIVRGGTGASDAAAARAALGIDAAMTAALAGKAASSHTHDASAITTGVLDAARLPPLSFDGLFYKADHESVAFTKTGNGTAEIKAGTKVEVNGSIVEFSTATAITMPTLAAGTDYYVWLHPDGTVEATANPTTPPVANARKIGGFHYAPGGFATAFNAGGNTTPQIIATSFWDLKWRAKCGDNRGMNYFSPAANAAIGGWWLDLYLLGVNHHLDGTSAYNVTIADGATPPKIPLMFGGDGLADYGGFTRFEAAEVFASHGKQLMSYDEFMCAAYGTDEATDGGSDPVSTILREAFTSHHMFLASGNMWIWGREFGGPDSGASWNTSTEGRGSVYNQPNAALFGGAWDGGANAGSRASAWSNAPWLSPSSLGARGRSDHLCLV